MKSNHGIVLFVMNVFICVIFMLASCYGADDSKKFDVIKFGDHNWLVLDSQDGKALILSEKVIERRAYRDPITSITWSECDIRKYLNTEFLESFSIEDRERILDTKVVTNNNPWYNTDGGEDTTDKIFLLSLEEVVKYFGDSGQLNNRPNNDTHAISDQYNQQRIAYDKYGLASLWWLRSPGALTNLAITIYYVGDVYLIGADVDIDVGGVRPALWLMLQ